MIIVPTNTSRSGFSGTVVDTIPLTGITATKPAISPDGTRLYVVTGTNIQVINTSTKAVVTTIAVGASQCSCVMAPDGLSLWIASGNGVQKYNIAAGTISGALTASFPLVYALEPAITPNGQYICYPSRSSNVGVMVFNTSTNALVTVPNTANDYYFGTSAAIDNSGFFACGINSTEVQKISVGASKIVIGNIAYGWGMAVNRRTGKFVVGSGTSGVTEIFDPSSPYTKTTVAGYSGSPRAGSDGPENLVFMAAGTTIAAIDTVTNTVTATYVGAGGSTTNGMVWSETTQSLYFLDAGNNQIKVIK